MKSLKSKVRSLRTRAEFRRSDFRLQTSNFRLQVAGFFSNLLVDCLLELTTGPLRSHPTAQACAAGPRIVAARNSRLSACCKWHSISSDGPLGGRASVDDGVDEVGSQRRHPV